MPQFDFSTYSSQIFWLFICFGIFFSFVKFYFLPKMDEILLERNRNIAGKIDEAKRINEEAESVEKKSIEFVKKTDIEINQIISGAEFDAKSQYESALRDVSNDARAMVANAVSKLQSETNNSVNIESATRAVSRAIFEKLGLKLTEQEIQNIYDEVKRGS